MLRLVNQYIHTRLALRLLWRDLLIVCGIPSSSPHKQKTQTSIVSPSGVSCPLQHTESELAVLEQELQLAMLMDVTPAGRQPSCTITTTPGDGTPRTKSHALNSESVTPTCHKGSGGRYTTAATRLQNEKHVSQYSRDDVAVALLAKFQRA